MKWGWTGGLMHDEVRLQGTDERIRRRGGRGN